MLRPTEFSPLNEQSLAILDRPVFVVGAPRSGTTWLQRLLVSFPEVVGGAESSFFLIFGRGLREIQQAQKGSRGAGLTNYWTIPDLIAEFNGLWRRTMTPMLSTKPGATILSEKTPSHAMYLPEIREILPQSRFIHIIRDSRAVVASLLAAHNTWGRDWAPTDARQAAIWWQRHTHAAREAGKVIGPSAYIEVFYEDLRANPAPRLKSILDFLGLHPPDDVLKQVISEQSFEHQKEIAGTPFVHDQATTHREPEGFFRRGETDGWKRELSLYQKLVVWRYTRRLMYACGYGWNGRV